MKWLYWCIPPMLLLTAATALYLFRKKDREPELDGGTRHYVDTGAPKVIRSTRITAFRCAFSTYDLPLNTSELAGCGFTLQASQTGGSLQKRGRDGDENLQVKPDDSFWQQLQQIVSDHNFAQHNGSFYTVSGLPDMFGAVLDITYASGEYIQCANNQDNFIPLAAMEALVALFREYAQSTHPGGGAV